MSRTYEIPEDLSYFVDRGLYEQKMSTTNMAFLLSQHSNDGNAEFLKSEFFEEMHEKLINNTASAWVIKNELVKTLTGEYASNYTIDTSERILTVRGD